MFCPLTAGEPDPVAADQRSVIKWGKLLLTAARSWKTDNVFKHSAAVSFYTLFSLAPIMIIALTVTGFFLGADVASEQLGKQIAQLVGPASAELIQSAVQASQQEKESTWATAVGVGLLLFGATTVFGQLQESMNQIWDVRAKPTAKGWMILLVHRLLSFAMVLTVGFLLLVSLVLSTTLTGMLERFHGGSSASAALLKAADLGVGFLVITILFALLFKVLPDVVLRWRDVLVSAVLTSLLFTGGRYLIALYLAHSTVASVYGAAGSLVALLIWIYYSCAILFFGVEFTRAYRAANHLKVQPKETAVVVREQIVSTHRRGAHASAGAGTAH